MLHEHIITTIEPGSIAEEMEIMPGDVLLSIDGKEITDIFDYRLACQQERLTVLIRKGRGSTDRDASTGALSRAAEQDTAATAPAEASVESRDTAVTAPAEASVETQDEEWELEIEKDPCEDLGLGFDSGLMDRYRSCRNGCVFCFIDQMPPGMRDTLYFKDDDARLSFLQGNYITLTNMTEREISRILEYHLSPINVSFHTTNPALRCRMLRNPKAGEALLQAKRLAAEGTGIELNGQIVLCKGLNDGEELDRSMHELFTDYAPGLKSVSVVPVGITRHRKGLYPLKPYTPADARAVLAQIHAFQEKALQARGTRFVFAADEWYLLAAQDTEAAARDVMCFPPAEAYEGYPQLENGVGMIRLFVEEFRAALLRLHSTDEEYKTKLRKVKCVISLCTGQLPFPVLRELLDGAARLAPERTVHLYPVRNDFFGPYITVSGLLTGTDIIRQLRGKPLGQKLILPANLLRAGERVLLDNVTVDEISSALGVPVVTGGQSGYDLVSALFDLPEDFFHEENGVMCNGCAGNNPYELPEV